MRGYPTSCSFHKGHLRKIKSTLAQLLCFVFLWAQQTYAQQATGPQIVPDGKTQTSLTVTGNVTNVTTSTIQGNNAYNSFTNFNVYSGNVVNLDLPNGTSNLLNLVNSSPVDIEGILNAIQNGKIGGNVYFADPFGLVVGQKGVVNVGSFTALTPTEDFINSFFDANGNPSASATASILGGTVPIDPSGLISVRGKINAISDIRLAGGTIANAGSIASGAVFSGSKSDFSDVVNINGLQSGNSIAVQNGNIYIQSAGDFENSGSIATNGANGLNAGNINIQAGQNIKVDSGSSISANGVGSNSNGGNIQIFAQGNSTLDSGAVVSAAGGNVSGNGGAIDFSAKGTVDLGGLLKAGATNGKAGSATVDPTDLNLTANDTPNDGTDITLSADNSITVNPGVVVSSRQISPTDLSNGNFLNAASTGNSGNISLTAPNIAVGDGAQILANANNGFTAGDITLTATQSVADGLLPPLPSVSANTQINIGNATISGGSISITADAEADANKTPNSDANVFLNDTSLGTLVGSYGVVSYKAASATSGITIGNSSTAGTASITGSGNVTISSTAGSTSVSDLVGMSGFAYGQSDSTATATVSPNATIAASGTLAINSASNNTLSVKESTAADSPGVIAVAYGNASSTSTTQIDGSVSGGAVQIGATNTNNFETQASAKPFSTSSSSAPANGGGAGIALGFYESNATANVTGSVTSNSGDATVSSTSNNEQDAVFSSSSVPTTGGFGSKVAQAQNIVQNFGGFLSQSSLLPNSALSTGQVGQLGIAASVSFVEGSNTATTTVTGTVSSANNTNISSTATDAPQISAAGSVSGQQTDLGGAVAISNFSNTADTYVNGGAQVDSLLGSTSITANATMVNPAVNRADLIADDQNFSGALSDIETVVKDIATGLGIIGNPGEFTTSFVNAGITTQAGDLGLQGDNVGLAGSVSVQSLTNQATASITGTGTSVKAGYNPDSSINASANGNVNVTADASLTSFNVAGTGFSVGQIAKLNPGVNSGSSLGGSANVLSVTNDSTAYVGDGTTVEAASTGNTNGKVQVSSDTETFEVAIAQAGDKAEQFGVSGTVDYLSLNDSSSAYIQSDATVAATNDVDVNAANNLLEFAVGGALGLGGKGQLDVGVNWNNIHQTTLAYIGDPSNSRASICPDCGVTAGGNVNVDANSSEHLYAVTFAAASSGNSPPKVAGPPTAKQAQNGAGGGKFSFGASGEIAINQAGSASSPGIVTQAFINNGANVSATGQVNVGSNDSSLFVNAALAGALAGGTGVPSGAALAGAYDQNTISKDVEAFTNNSTIGGSGLSVDATDATKLFAVTVGGAVNTLPSGVALAGAVNNNAIYNNINASLGDGTSAENIGSAGVTVNAQEGADQIVSAAGGFAGGGTGGIGAAVDIGNYNNTVTASIGNGNIGTTGNVQVTSNTNATYLPIAVSFAGDSSFGAAGSVAVESISDTTTSSVAGTVSAGQNLLVASQDSSSATMIAGGAGIGGSVGVDVSALLPDFSRNTTASIADGANVSVPGSDAAAISYDSQNDVGILLDAHTSGGLQDYVVGGSGGGISLGGAIIVNQPGSNSLSDTTSATIGQNATVNGNNSGAAADQSVSLLATDSSSILDVAGMLAIGGDAGAGVGYDQTNPTWTVSTSIGSGSTVNAAGNVVLDSSLQNSLQSYAIVGAASGGEITGSVTGATSVINETSNVGANENGTVNAGGSVEVAADRNTSSLNALDGNAAVAISFGAGVGVSLADITTNDTVDASIGGTGNVTALGNSSLNVPDGLLDGNGNPETSSFQGVSVTAMSHTSINPFVAGVAGSGIVGGQGSVVVDNFTETTQAHIDSGAQVNVNGDSGANASQSVQALATDVTDLNSTAGGVSLGGLALTASVDTETMNRTVGAFISGATVNAANNVLVDGSMLGSITSTAVAGSAGGFAADGAVSDINETTNTNAYVDGGSVVTANGNVNILANRNTSLTTQDGSVALGGVLGANGSVSTVIKNDTVSAYVGSNTSVTALGQGSGLVVPVDNSGSLSTGTVNGLSVAATAQENLQSIALGASATEGFSGTGSVTTNIITENTSANIQSGADINGNNSGAAAEQGVNLLASDQTNLTSGAGAAAISLDIGAGIGGAADAGIIQKTTTAGIDNGATVNAQGAVNVDALSTESISSYVAAAGGSLGVGLAGTTADYSTNPVQTTTTAYVGSCISSGGCSGGVTVNAGSLGVNANDNMNFSASTGELSLGLAGLGAGTFEMTADGNTSAYIGALSNITTNSGGASVNSTFSDNLRGTAAAGSGSVLASGDAAVGSITDNSNNSAFIGDGTIVQSAGDVNVTANTTRNLSASGTGLAVSIGLAGGAVIAQTRTAGSTDAYLGNNVTVGANNLEIGAGDNSAASSSTTALSAGIGAATFNNSTADLGGTIHASIGNSAEINLTGNLSVTASSMYTVNSTSSGSQFGVGTGGADDAEASASPTVIAFIGDNENINLGGNFTLQASQGNECFFSFCFPVGSVTASASTTSGSFAGGTGSNATATANPTFIAFVGDGNNTSTNISAGGNLTIQSSSAPTVSSSADSTTYAAGANASVNATSTINNDSTVFTGPNVSLSAANITLNASSTTNGQSTVNGGGGGVYQGGGDTAETDLTDTTNATVGSNNVFSAANTGTILVQTLANDLGYSTSNDTIGALVGIPETTSNVNDTTTATTEIGPNASLNGSTVNLNAKVTGLDLQANSTSQSSAGYAAATANATINGTATPTVNVDGNATINGSNVNISARLDNVDSDTNATATTYGLTGTANANASNNLLVNPTVYAAPGSTFNTNNLYVESLLPVSSPGDNVYSNSETANNDTVTGVVIGFLENTGETIANGLTSFGNDIASGAQSFGDDVSSVFDPPPSGLTTTNTINFNGTVVQNGGGSASLTVGPDGQVLQQSNIGTPTISNNQVIVPNIVDNSQSNITFNVPGGTLTGNMTINRAANFDSVDITNESNLDLVLNQMQPFSTNGGQPTWNVSAATNTSNVTIVPHDNPTSIDIQNESGSNIIFEGFINNPLGSLLAVDQNGSILGTSGNTLKANSIDLSANHGSIGSLDQSLNIQLPDDLSTVQSGLVVPQVSVLAGGDINLNVDAVQDVNSPPSGSPTLSANLNSIVAGGGINLNLQQGQFLVAQPIVLPFGGVTVSNYSLPANATYTIPATFQTANNTTAPGQVIGGGNVTVATGNGADLNVNGTLTSGFQDINFNVDANGNVDPNLINYASSIDANNVNLGTILNQGGNVTITGTGSLTGSGTIQVLDGYSHVNVSNESSKNLVVNNINLDNRVNGTISIFGTTSNVGSGIPSTYGGSLALTSYGYSTGQINILNDPASGSSAIDLAGRIGNQSGSTSITNTTGSITNTGGSNQLVESNSIGLSATQGTIGKPVNVQLTGGSLSASAAGDVNLNAPTGTLSVDTITSANGNVNLNAAAGNIGLGVAQAALNANLTAEGSILNTTGAASNINAQDITLTATNGTIGTITPSSTPVNINSTSLTATAGSDINVNEVTGPLNVNTVTSTNGSVDLSAAAGNINLGVVQAQQNATLTAAGSILNATSPASNVNAQNVTLTATNGTIGTLTPSANPLNINSTSLNATASGDVNINEVTGTLNVNAVTSNTGNVTLDSLAGDIDLLGAVSSPVGTTDLIAFGSILDPASPNPSHLNAVNVNLTVQNGSIGTSGSLLAIDSSFSGPGIVNALAKLGVYLKEVNGPLNVNVIQSQTGDIVIVSDGSILNASNPAINPGGINLIGNNINLTSLNGSIGQAGNMLVVDNRNPSTGISGTNYLDMAANGDIYVNEPNGNVLSHSISSATGNIDLLVGNGNGSLGQVLGTENVILLVQGNLLDINKMTGSDLTMAVTQDGGQLNVQEADVLNSVTIRADNVLLNNVIHTNPANPQLVADVQANGLHFDVRGNDGLLANNVVINVAPCPTCFATPPVIFDDLLANNATVNAKVNWLEFINTSIAGSANFQNNFQTFNLAALKTTAQPTSFYLFLIGSKQSTNLSPTLFKFKTFINPTNHAVYAQPISQIFSYLLTFYGF